MSDTERPILFSATMVRALLAGTKTQTRRIVKPQPNDPHHFRIVGPDGEVHYTRPEGSALLFEARELPNYKVLSCAEWLASRGCPYGQPGDRLWVRENFYCDHIHYPEGCPISVRWREVDGKPVAIPMDEQRAEMRHLTYYQADGDPGFEEGGKVRWRPSIHLPRWLSRITLEITGVRVERLREISRGDAMKEGCPFSNMASGPSPRDWYASLWDEINGPGSWDANPWVWVIEFRRISNAKVCWPAPLSPTGEKPDAAGSGSTAVVGQTSFTGE